MLRFITETRKGSFLLLVASMFVDIGGAVWAERVPEKVKNLEKYHARGPTLPLCHDSIVVRSGAN